jgi:hypothetical protein
MKRIFIMIFLGFEAYNLKAQQGPTGNVPANNTTAQAAASTFGLYF